jgi:hypothetical protein
MYDVDSEDEVEQVKQRKPVYQMVEFPPDYAEWDISKQARWNVENVALKDGNLSFVIPNKKNDEVFYTTNTSEGVNVCTKAYFERLIEKNFPELLIPRFLEWFFSLMKPGEKRELHNKILKRDPSLNYWE